MSFTRPVVGLESRYEVSSTGIVFSLKHKKALAQNIGKDGRLVVSLYDGKKGVLKRVHVLVAEAFLGPRPEGMFVCHGPEGGLCNAVSNLSYKTPAENTNDRWRDGTMNHGESHPMNKLNIDEARQIKKRLAAGESPVLIAKDYPHVSKSAVKHIKAGKTWAWL